MKIINIGLVGAGWIVQKAHIPSLLKLNNVILAAIYDIDKDNAVHVANEFNIKKVCENINDFYSLDIDAVIIATPNKTHAQYSLNMLNHGISVLCEKPVALHAEEIDQIKQAETEHNVIYIPGFVNRFRNDIQRIFEIVDSGSIGDIKSVNACWVRRSGVPRPGTWFTNKKMSGGGVLVDLGSHILDICLYLLKNKRAFEYLLNIYCESDQSINCEGAANWFNTEYSKEYNIDVEDTVSANVRYADGTLMNVKLSWSAPIEADYTSFEIFGSKGKVELKTLFGFSNERLYSEDTLSVEIGGNVFSDIIDKKQNNTYRAFDRMIKHFIDSILSRKKCIGSDDAFRTVEAIEKLYNIKNIKYIQGKQRFLEE